MPRWPGRWSGVQVDGLREIVMILEFKRQDLGVSAIARQTGLDRRTVKKDLQLGLEARSTDPESRAIDWQTGFDRI